MIFYSISVHPQVGKKSCCLSCATQLAVPVLLPYFTIKLQSGQIVEGLND